MKTVASEGSGCLRDPCSRVGPDAGWVPDSASSSYQFCALASPMLASTAAQVGVKAWLRCEVSAWKIRTWRSG